MSNKTVRLISIKDSVHRFIGKLDSFESGKLMLVDTIQFQEMVGPDKAGVPVSYPLVLLLGKLIVKSDEVSYHVDIDNKSPYYTTYMEAISGIDLGLAKKITN